MGLGIAKWVHDESRRWMVRLMGDRTSSGEQTARGSATKEPCEAMRIVEEMEDGRHSAADLCMFEARAAGLGIDGQTARHHSVVGCCESTCIGIRASIQERPGGGGYVFASLPELQVPVLPLRAHGVEHGSAGCGVGNR